MSRGRGKAKRTVQTLGAKSNLARPVLLRNLDPADIKLDHRYITNARQLRTELVPFLEEPQVGLDIETAVNRGGGVTGGVPRLIQLGMQREDGVVRQLVLDLHDVDPRPIFPLLKDKSRESVIHNAMYEQYWLAYHFGARIGNILDTCLTWKKIHEARAAGNEDYSAGHGNSLGEVTNLLLAIQMDKTEGTSNWGLNDLTPSQVEYSAWDVAVLMCLAEETKRVALAEGCLLTAMEEGNRMWFKAQAYINRKTKEGVMDESPRLYAALLRAKTPQELDQLWQLGKSRLTLQNESKRQMASFYQARRKELTSS